MVFLIYSQKHILWGHSELDNYNPIRFLLGQMNFCTDYPKNM